MPTLAVKPKLASGLPEKLIDDRVIAVAHLAADLHQENLAANDEHASGALHDSESGLIYNGANYYDPKTGRWTSPDGMSIAEHVERWRARMGVPGEPPLEINPYVRVLNNPLKWIDSDGLAAARAPVRGGGRSGGTLGGPARNEKASAWMDYFGQLGELWGTKPPKFNQPCIKWDCSPPGECRADNTQATPAGSSSSKCRCVEYAPLTVE